jgi:hypothetical protein
MIALLIEPDIGEYSSFFTSAKRFHIARFQDGANRRPPIEPAVRRRLDMSAEAVKQRASAAGVESGDHVIRRNVFVHVGEAATA